MTTTIHLNNVIKWLKKSEYITEKPHEDTDATLYD